MTTTTGLLVRVTAPDDLLMHETLERLLGPITSVVVQPMHTPGYSGATFERIAVRLQSGRTESLICKRVRLTEDWTAYRTGDRLGREVALLTEPRLLGVWEMVACPYRAYAASGGSLGMLMTDLGPWLLPDVDAPLEPDQEDRILHSLAGLHARYWEADVLDLSWLSQPARLLATLGPEAPGSATGRPLEPMFEKVRDGWSAALGRLPRRTAHWLVRPPEELLGMLSAGLPRTLVHGDVKVANFALPPGKVAAIDWAWVGAGPCALDLGWYLAVNAGRLAHTKDEVLNRYRALLQQALGRRIPDLTWERLVRVAVLVGARLLLWAKALALESGSPQAVDEWDWWLEALDCRVLPELERRRSAGLYST